MKLRQRREISIDIQFHINSFNSYGIVHLPNTNLLFLNFVKYNSFFYFVILLFPLLFRFASFIFLHIDILFIKTYFIAIVPLRSANKFSYLQIN